MYHFQVPKWRFQEKMQRAAEVWQKQLAARDSAEAKNFGEGTWGEIPKVVFLITLSLLSLLLLFFADLFTHLAASPKQP